MNSGNSFYREITLALIALVCFVSVAEVAVNYLYQKREVAALYRQKTAEYSAYLADALEWPLWNVDEDLVAKIGSTFTSNEEFASLVIRDDRGKIIYRREKPAARQTRKGLVIRHEGHEIGTVEFGVSLSGYEAKDRQLLLNGMLTMILLVAVLLGAMRWILSRLLRKPVDSLVAATGAMVEGKYGAIALPEIYLEFAPILAGFKTMSDAVESRELSLKRSNERLASEIAERRQVEEALRRSEERLQLAAAAGNIGVWDWDIVKDILLWDDSMYSLYGISREEFGGAYEAWSKMLHSEDREHAEGEIRAALRGDREYAPEFRIVRPDGSVRSIKAASRTYRDESGRPVRMVGTNIDITARKETEEKLRSASSYTRSLIEASLDPLVTISPEGKITDVNRATESATGRSRRDLVGTDFSDYFTEPEKAREGYLQVFEKGYVTDYPLAIRHREGRVTDVLYNASIFRDDSGAVLGVFAAARDITERKRAEEELRRYKDHLEEEVQQRTADLVLARNAAEAANRAKSVFLASMSHELRTPLNSILGFSSLMRKDAALSGSQRETLDIIARSGEHLLTLINDVLEMAKIEAGRIEMENEPLDLGNLVRDVIDMMQVRAREKGLRLLIDQSSEFPRFIRGDEARLRQVIINLVGNAVKFTDQGGVTLRLGVKSNAQMHLLVEVEDSGIGIREEDQKMLFQPFVQFGESAIQKGTGLGLSITKQYVELMGGKIGFESAFGKGSVFRVELPVENILESEIDSRRREETREIAGLAPDSPRFSILIVEDQKENQLLLFQLMKRIGLDTLIAENGKEAVEIFDKWHPDLIWMDRRMPVMDGIEATRKIREMPGGGKVKIVAVTASAFREQREELLSAGMDDFVRKPYRFNEIYDCLKRQLGVEYVYEGGEAEEREATLEKGMLSVLPDDLRVELKGALESLESGRIESALGKVSSIDPQLFRVLARLVENYNYPAILQEIGG